MIKCGLVEQHFAQGRVGQRVEHAVQPMHVVEADAQKDPVVPAAR